MKAVILAISALTLAAVAPAQNDKMAPMGEGEATIYRDVNFQGPAVFVGEAKPDLGLSWPVRSVRVKRGTWEICSRTRYRGRCAIVAADEPDLRGRTGLFDTVQSMRPMGARPPEDIAPPAGTSLRGMSSEFFPAPGDANGRRIVSCATSSGSANCAAKTADDFCKSVGWSGSARETQETVGRRIYLADVLCTRTGY